MMKLPHTKTARLLTDIVRSDAARIEANGRIPSAHPLVTAGRAPCFLGIELGAQAAAAWQALAHEGDRAAPIGRLARVREAVFLSPNLPVDTPLRVIAEVEATAPPLAIYRIRVSVGDIEALRATISVTTKAFESRTTGEVPD